MADNWFRTDGPQDVAGSIRHAIRTAQFIQEDDQAWKWVVLALHSALQGACVGHLMTTAHPLGAVTKSNTREWLCYYEKERTDPTAVPPKTKLMALPELLKAIRKSDSADGSSPPKITISDPELDWLQRFHMTFRNQFTHFEPMGWSIEVSGFPGMAALIARIIDDIIECEWAFRDMAFDYPDQLEELKRNLQTLKSPEWLAPTQGT